MPGPVSDSYDPEFSTASNRDDVCAAAAEVSKVVTREVLHDEKLLPIVALAQQRNAHSRKRRGELTERHWRIIRFCLNRMAEDQ